MKTVALFLIGIYLALGQVEAHPIHISVTNLEIEEDSNRIEYSIRLYSDDFQTLINFKYNTLLSFANQTRMTTKEQSAIIDYISKKFMIQVNNDTLVSEFLAWKVESELVWLSFCAKLHEKIEFIKIENSIMLDSFEDQTNLLIAQEGEKQSALEFNKRNTIQRIVF